MKNQRQFTLRTLFLVISGCALILGMWHAFGYPGVLAIYDATILGLIIKRYRLPWGYSSQDPIFWLSIIVLTLLLHLAAFPAVEI